MKLNKFIKLSLGALFAIPLSLFGGEILANNFSNTSVEYKMNDNQLMACGGGGGGGSSPAARKAKKAKKTKAKLNFKKRELAKRAAAGEPIDNLQSEIDELEAILENLKK